MDSLQAPQQHHRLISSNLIESTNLAPVPQETIKYIERPVIKEELRYVPKKEVIEIEKLVPVYDVQTREKFVEVPQVEVVETEVELEQVQEIVRRVPVKKQIVVPKEVIKYAKKIEIKKVEQQIEVPGDVIQVAKPYTVTKEVVVPRYTTHEKATVVSQVLKPIVKESAEDFVEVVCKEYEPVLVPVALYVPRPVSRELLPGGRHEKHHTVDVPPSQFNALVRGVNPIAPDAEIDGLFIKHPDGGIPMLNAPGSIVSPSTDEWQSTHNQGAIHIQASFSGQHYVMPTFNDDQSNTRASNGRLSSVMAG